MFEDLGLQYEDVRYTADEVPAVQEELVSSGAILFGELPVVVVNGQTISQTFAIFRYFARVFGDPSVSSSYVFLFMFESNWSSSLISFFCYCLPRATDLYGSTQDEQYTLDLTLSAFLDVQDVVAVLWSNNETAKELFWKEKAGKVLTLLDKLYSANGGPYVLGEKISFVDFAGHLVIAKCSEDPGFHDTYKSLSAFLKAFHSRPKIAAYLASDRVPK